MRKINIFITNSIYYIYNTTSNAILETLFGLNYLWYAVLIFFSLPVQSRLFDYFYLYLPRLLVGLLFLTLATAIYIGVHYGNIVLRQLNLLTNTFICIIYGVSTLVTKPSGAAAGFLFILAFLSSVRIIQMELNKTKRLET